VEKNFLGDVWQNIVKIVFTFLVYFVAKKLKLLVKEEMGLSIVLGVVLVRPFFAPLKFKQKLLDIMVLTTLDGKVEEYLEKTAIYFLRFMVKDFLSTGMLWNSFWAESLRLMKHCTTLTTTGLIIDWKTLR